MAWVQPTWAAEPARILTLEDEARSRPDLAREKLLLVRSTMTPNDPDQIDMLRVLGKVAFDLGERDQAERYAMELDQCAVRLQPARNRDDAQAAAACLRAAISRDRAPLNQLNTLIDDVLRTLGPDSRVGVRLACLHVSATVKESMGQLEQAIARHHEAIVLADTERVHWAASSFRVLKSDSLRRAGQLEQAEAANAEARRIANEQGDWRSLTEVLQMQSMLATERGQVEEQLQALQQAITYARRAGSLRDEALTMGNLADVFLQRKDYAQALELAQRTLPLARQAHYQEAERLAQLNMGFALIGLRRKNEGLALVRGVVEQGRGTEEVIETAETLQELGRVLEASGYAADAYAAYRDRRALADEVSRQARQHAVLELQEKFEAERRHREKALLADEGHLHEEALRRESLLFRLWVLVAALALLLLGLAMVMYRRMRAVQQSLRRSNESLKEQSEQDPLTGLANRRHGQQLMAAQAQAQGTLYLLDLDHFKQVNDHLGHAAGDVVLQEVARRLKAVLREGDEVYRWGGEEFLILVQSSTPEQTDMLAQRLLQALAALPVLFDTRHLAVTASIGYADFPLPPGPLQLSWDQALDLVDAAMYLAKTQGRNRACGVRHLPVSDEAGLQALMQDFERSWRNGGLTLVEAAGPAPAGDPA